MLALCLGFTLQAQDKPAPSPFSKVEQKVGLTDVTIEYSRPSLKGRKAIGHDLVPYDGPWRTGANSATKITFSDDVTIEGQELMAGSYALTTKAGKDSWEIHFHEYGESRPYGYLEKDGKVKVVVTPVMIDHTVETFLINIDELRDNSATLKLVWEKTMVPIKMGVK